MKLKFPHSAPLEMPFHMVCFLPKSKLSISNFCPKTMDRQALYNVSALIVTLQPYLPFSSYETQLAHLPAFSPPTPPSSPPPGDLLYLDVTTLEGQEFHMTAVPAGFYLNKSTGEDHFDPSPRKKHAHLSKTLVQLLQLVSQNCAIVISSSMIIH